ncbi:hypothetical protein MPL3356_140270 [Mesorhizobium plurifarium]|uniref:Uncharacterized protein n=1 Tax=Mesorhizobium plurifarium TaxID=69974 RepID=A0A090DDL6_MESPL|nr:hypothetical protein MPL3356_140270 [Mesorhizobium plurifarium]
MVRGIRAHRTRYRARRADPQEALAQPSEPSACGTRRRHWPYHHRHSFCPVRRLVRICASGSAGTGRAARDHRALRACVRAYKEPAFRSWQPSQAPPKNSGLKSAPDRAGPHPWLSQGTRTNVDDPRSKTATSTADGGLGDVNAKVVDQLPTIIRCHRDQGRAGNFNGGYGRSQRFQFAIAHPKSEPEETPAQKGQGADPAQALMDLGYLAAESRGLGMVEGDAAKEPGADGEYSCGRRRKTGNRTHATACRNGIAVRERGEVDDHKRVHKHDGKMHENRMDMLNFRHCKCSPGRLRLLVSQALDRLLVVTIAKFLVTALGGPVAATFVVADTLDRLGTGATHHWDGLEVDCRRSSDGCGCA